MLSSFATDLTGITQADVAAAPLLADVLGLHRRWLSEQRLVDEATGEKIGHWSMATWSDADAAQLAKELKHKRLPLPSYFESWIDLKHSYKSHYQRGPADHGGLRGCVEAAGLTFEGRAHNGLVDSLNTAALVVDMSRGGMVFRSATRGIDPRDGELYGSNANLKQRAASRAPSTEKRPV